MKSGIYQIRNIITGRLYIGSATNFDTRKATHNFLLRENRHHSKYLQRSYNKHGKDSFRFEVLFTCPKEDLIRLEQYCIDNYNPLYNSCRIAGSSLGRVLTSEHKRKIGLAFKGRKHSEETKKKMSASGKNVIHTVEQHLKVGAKRARPILKICLITEQVLERFDSVRNAAKSLGVTEGNIASCARGNIPKASGFKWKYE